MELRDQAWRAGGLKETYFGDREIIENEEVIALDVPGRAEDGAKVPVHIQAVISQTEQRYIKTVTLLIDANPVPLAGTFMFTPKSGKADLRMRVRVDNYTAIRAIAETNDGQLYMSSRFVKASGGCSAPMASDLDSALSRLGKMKIRTTTQASAVATPVMLNISHPNITGLQMNEIPRSYLPPHFIQEIKVTFNDETVMTAETDVSISSDPSFGFYFVPDQAGELRAEFTDSQGKTFSKVHKIKMDR
jgi:sulfur-oxidizing protein SoxY